MRIIHLSDIHFKNSQQDNVVFLSLIADLCKINNQNKIDLIFITGDLVNRGGSDFNCLYDGFKIFEKNFVNVLIERLNIEKENIIFCAGNHDIDRNKIDEYVEEGLRNKLCSIEEVNKFIEKRTNDFDNTIERIKDFKEFEIQYNQDNKNSKITNFESNYIVKIDNYRVGITALNSSWRCSDEENNLILGLKQIENSKEFLSKCDIKIALIHHSFEFFQEFEKNKVKDTLSEFYDYLFLGHVHTNDSYINIGLFGSLFTSIAQSNSTDNLKEKDVLYSLGYSIVDLEFESYNIRIAGRRYSNNLNEYVKNVDVFGDNGYKDYPMLLNEEKEEKKNIRSLLQKIKEIHLDDCNEHLLSYKTDSKAPKTINEIFIMPSILGEKEEEHKDEEKKYSLEDIYDSDKNIVIFGVKESGKTILLDRLAIKIVEKFDKYGKLPVRIDLQDMSSNNIETEIKRYLSVKQAEEKNLLESGNIILLIDNVIFMDAYRKQIDSIKKFITNYKNVKVIMVSENKIDREAPINFVKDEFFRNFINLYIGSWNSKEINNIITTWFSNNEYSKTNVTVREIVKIFGIVKMSITPLNISMFLWIIEHQKNYKLINKGKLMECFFEYLLQKLKGEDAYSDTFDYTNKIRLLSHIAYEMFNNIENKYKIEYLKLLNFTKEYFKNRKFIIDYEEIIKYFINKGIFIEQIDNGEKYIVFRFECFYRFFITQYMLHNKEFKMFAIEETNFLKFQDEIEYLTGINRDEVELLQLLTQRMEENFYDLEQIICDNDRCLDSYFKTTKAIVDKIDDKSIDKIKEEKKHIDAKSLSENLNDKELSIIQKEIAIGEVKDKVAECKVDELFDIWSLVAKVLKNTEETNEMNIKNNIYLKVIKTSILYFILYKFIIDTMIKDGLEKNPDEIKYQIMRDLDITSKIIPLINSQEINKLLATSKLEMVVIEEIEKYDTENTNSSELEKALSLLLLLKINNAKAIEYIEKFSKKIKQKYIRDLIMINLVYEYYSINNAVLERRYIMAISNLKIDMEKNKQEATMFKKSQVIEELKNQKKIIQKEIIFG